MSPENLQPRQNPPPHAPFSSWPALPVGRVEGRQHWPVAQTQIQYHTSQTLLFLLWTRVGEQQQENTKQKRKMSEIMSCPPLRESKGSGPAQHCRASKCSVTCELIGPRPQNATQAAYLLACIHANLASHRRLSNLSHTTSCIPHSHFGSSVCSRERSLTGLSPRSSSAS